MNASLSTAATPTSIGGGLYQQVHNIGPLQGKSFTTQIVRPDTTGVLSQNAFTYPGCKVTAWEVSVATNAEVKAKLTIDALDEATPSNGFSPTTLAAAVTAGAATISTKPSGSATAIRKARAKSRDTPASTRKRWRGSTGAPEARAKAAKLTARWEDLEARKGS